MHTLRRKICLGGASSGWQCKFKNDTFVQEIVLCGFALAAWPAIVFIGVVDLIPIV
jgi:hypothetical protein